MNSNDLERIFSAPPRSGAATLGWSAPPSRRLARANTHALSDVERAAAPEALRILDTDDLSGIDLEKEGPELAQSIAAARVHAQGPVEPSAAASPPIEEPLPTLSALEARPIREVRRAKEPQPACGLSDVTQERPLMEARRLKKSYRKGRIEVPVLQDVSLHVERGEFLAIVGQSGSGKSTLLHLLATLDAPDDGEVHFCGQRIDNTAGPSRDTLRNKHLGMIFQFYHLIPEFTTLENVLAPLMIAEGVWSYFWRRRKHRAAALELLERVGLTHRIKHRPSELSGGEMQRAAIARALISRPQLLLADEPTGNLDQGTGEEIIRILRTLNREQNVTIVMVTHDLAIAAQADRTVRLVGGRLQEG